MSFIKITGDIHFEKFQDNDAEFKIENIGNNDTSLQKLSLYHVDNVSSNTGLHIHKNTVCINDDTTGYPNNALIVNGPSLFKNETKQLGELKIYDSLHVVDNQDVNNEMLLFKIDKNTGNTNVTKNLNVNETIECQKLKPNNQFIVPKHTDDPSTNLEEGMIYFNTTTKIFRGYNGTSWNNL